MTESSATVLVVDDEPKALALMVSILARQGYNVQPADSGKLALVSVAARAPDLVLLDLKMPGINGFEVCRRLKATETGRRVPVIFLSASTEKADWVHALSLGAADFISKPFQYEELLARVRTHVELGRLQGELETLVAQRTAELRLAIDQLRVEVAERLRAEQALRESEERFRQIANAAPVIIWTSQPDNYVDFRNEYAQAFTGRTMETLVGDQWTELIHTDDLGRRQQEYYRGLESRHNFQLEYRVRHADGEFRWMLDKATPRFLPNGEFAGYVGIIFDLTDIKRSHDRALREKSLENLRALSAGIAHDFNSMIGTIFGEVDLARTEMEDDSPGRENIDRIDSVARRAADIVVLLMAYVGDRSDGPRSDRVDLGAVVREIVPHLKNPVLQKAEIRTCLAPRLCFVRGNLLQMRLVVLNLIINALEALEGEKGLVTIATSAIELGADSAREYSQPLADGQYVKLEVRDTGGGIAEGVRDRIFDPYYSTKSLGRGLGLAAVQGIVHAHRGAIHASSAPGEGTTLEVLLPSASDIGEFDS